MFFDISTNMDNSFLLTANTTSNKFHGDQLSNSALLYIISLVLLLGIFLLFNIVMLNAFFTTTYLREQIRYTILICILVNDAIYLFGCGYLTLSILLLYEMPVIACLVAVMFTWSTFLNTPNGLAILAVERYVAICYPFRHSEICQVERSCMVILAIFAIGLLPYVIDMAIVMSLIDQEVYFQKVLCYQETIFASQLRELFRIIIHSSDFAVVGVIMIYTYLKIMLEAKEINSNTASSSKASKTVILHAIHMLFCMTAFFSPIWRRINQFSGFNAGALNLFIFMLFPRFLTCLIYGFWEENFRNHLKKVLPCHP